MVNMLNLLSVPYTYSFVNISEIARNVQFSIVYMFWKYIYISCFWSHGARIRLRLSALVVRVYKSVGKFEIVRAQDRLVYFSISVWRIFT